LLEFLADYEKQKFASEIIKRILESNLPALSEDDLVPPAEELFLELDRKESKISLAQWRLIIDEGEQWFDLARNKLKLVLTFSKSFRSLSL